MHRRAFLMIFVAIMAGSLSACGGGGGSPTPPTFFVDGLGSGGTGTGAVTLSAATTYTLGATETAAGGGAVTPGTLTITLDNAAIGTVSGNTLVTGTANASGHVKVVDSRTGLSETIAVTVLSTHPATVGDTLTLAGSLVHAIARPLPAPSAIASPTTSTTNVTDVLRILSTTSTFGGKSKLTDENVVESDVSPLQSITTTSDTYTRFVATGARQALYAVGVSSSDSNGVRDTTTYGSGAGLIDELPDSSGATFANTGAQTFAETEPDGTTIARTVNADGTYTEADSYFGFSPASTTQTNADLSATLTYFGGLVVDVAYGAPSGTGASAAIPYAISLAIPSPPPATTGTIPDWFPTTTIFSDTAVKSTAQTIPSACHVSSSVGTTATKIVETTTHLDTALGTYETRVQTSFDAPGFGSVCVQLADTIDAYYDYTGQSLSTVFPGLNLALSATPIQIDTLSETLGFTTGSIQGSSSNRRSGSLATDSVLRAVSPVFDRAVRSIYRARRKAMVANLTTRKAALQKEIVR